MQPNLQDRIVINCFAINNGECSILNQTNCVNCKFFKTKNRLVYENYKRIERKQRLKEEG